MDKGTYREMMEVKFEEEPKQDAQPASPYMLRQMQEKLMRKFSTTYEPKRKVA